MLIIDRFAIFICIFLLGPFPFLFANNDKQIVGGYIIGGTISITYWTSRFIFNPDYLKKLFRKAKNENPVSDLEKMAKLKEAGHLTKEEFNKFKEQILSSDK